MVEKVDEKLDNKMDTLYKTEKYWDDRYNKQQDSYEWLENFETLKPFFDEIFEREQNILMSGCGNSDLSEEMYKYGFRNITNVDYSKEVINSMSRKTAVDFPEMEWVCSDVTDMKCFKDGQFEVVVDKCTLDSILCSEDGYLNAVKYINEVHRVLDVGGVFLCVSYANPEHRMKFFKNDLYDFAIQYFEVENIESNDDKKRSIDKKMMCIVFGTDVDKCFNYVYASVKLPDSDKKFNQNFNLEKVLEINNEWKTQKVGKLDEYDKNVL